MTSSGICTRSRARTLTKLQLADFDDASHVLDHRTTAAYLDAVHLSGDANGLVAHAIYDAWKDGR